MTPAPRSHHNEAPRTSWSRILVRIVMPALTLLLGLVGYLGAARLQAFEKRDDDIAQQTADLDRRQRATEQALTALAAAEEARTKLVLSGIERLEGKLDRHMERPAR